MPSTQSNQSLDNLNVKLVHSTKQSSPDSPLQLAFSVTDETGNEQIETAEVPNSIDLYEWCRENRFISSGRPQTRSMRRIASVA